MGFTWKNRRLTFETNLRFFFDFGRTTGQTPGVRHGGELFTRIFRASRQFESNEKQKRKSFPSDRPRLRRSRHRRKSRAPSAIRRDDLERKFSIKTSVFLEIRRSMRPILVVLPTLCIFKGFTRANLKRRHRICYTN